MASREKNQYWIPNIDINKKVIIKEIQYYLGPESTARPYTRDVCDQNSLLGNYTDQSTRAKMDSLSPHRASA
jgi:hypothetical protein